VKKVKYKSAEHKRKALEAEKFQEALYKKWGVDNSKPTKFKEYTPNYSHRSSNDKYESVTTKVSGGTRKETQKYTGSQQLLGICVMHKSNLVPVFKKQDAEDIARMRR
jgi:hypothetical protein